MNKDELFLEIVLREICIAAITDYTQYNIGKGTDAIKLIHSKLYVKDEDENKQKS